MAQIRRNATVIHEPAERVDVIEDDPTDNRIFNKKHLLPLGSFRGVSIIGLREFVDTLNKEAR